MRGVPVPSDSASADPPGLARWRAATRRANAAFRRGHYAAALSGYSHALRLADDLLASPELHRDPGACLAAFVISHHNLSDCLGREEPSPRAIEHLCLPHRRLRCLLEDDATALPVREAAVRHLRETRLALLGWLQRHGRDASVESALGSITYPPPDERASRPLH